MTMDRKLENLLSEAKDLMALMGLEHGITAPTLNLDEVSDFIEQYRGAAEKASIEKAEAEKAAAEAAKAAEAAEKAAAEKAEAAFLSWLNDNGFVGFAGKGGKIACLLEAKLKKAADQEAYELFGILQCQAADTAFDEGDFGRQLLNFESNGENCYCLIVFLNHKGDNPRLTKFGGSEVGTYFSK